MKKLIAIANLMIAIALLSNPSFAREGNEGGGGGKGFLCNENGTRKMYLADTYELHKKGLFNRFPGHGSVGFKTAVELIDKRFPQRAFPHPFFRGQKVTLGFMLAYLHGGQHFWSNEGDMDGSRGPREFADDNIRSVPAGCRKVQIALQDLRTGRVHVRKVWNEPSIQGADWFYLELHEALIALRNRPGMDTTPIRQQVKEIATILSNPENFALAVLQDLNRHWISRPIVPADRRPKFKTLYYAPQELTCELTWIGPRAKYGPRYSHPTRFKIVRTKGDGRVGDHNEYSMVVPWQFGGIARALNAKSTETSFYTETVNSFGDRDGEGTFGLSMKFFPRKDVELSIWVSDYDPVTGMYSGSSDIEDANAIHVADDGNEQGFRCWTQEQPIFRIDERSYNYEK